MKKTKLHEVRTDEDTEQLAAKKLIARTSGDHSHDMTSWAKRAASVSHEEATLAELRADPAFAAEYLKATLEELKHPVHHAVGLLALRDLAAVYGE